MSRVRILLVIVVCLFVFASPARAFVIINEFLSDPPSGLAGDANKDLTGSTSQDEFVELFNSGSAAVDLSGWQLADNYKTRHVFLADTILQAQGLIVVFGGGTPEDIPSLWQTASTGSLGLNNSGDSVIVYDAAGGLVEEVVYGADANSDQSLTRALQGVPGSDFVLHTSLAAAEGALFSPGYLPASSPSPQGASSVPEPLSVLTLGAGLISAVVLKRK